MSVLIKGMKMPKNCMICRFCVPEADPENGEMCMATGKYVPPCSTERRDDCPLVEVPTPHGPLVDADALKATFCAECNHTITCEDCDIDYHIGRLAPTIIEAEEGEPHEQN